MRMSSNKHFEVDDDSTLNKIVLEISETVCIESVRLVQESPNYGPRAKCGPRSRFIWPVKNENETVLPIMKKYNHENLLIWKNITYPKTITLRKMSGQSRRHRGALVGLARPNKAPSPPNWNLKHHKSVEFLSIFIVKPPLHERKAPPYNRKAPLLMTFWGRFCVRPSTCFVLAYVALGQKRLEAPGLVKL